MKKILILLTLLALGISGCDKDSARAGIIKTGTDYICPRFLYFNDQTIPCAIIASATFLKPAIFAPDTKSFLPLKLLLYSSAAADAAL